MSDEDESPSRALITASARRGVGAAIDSMMLRPMVILESWAEDVSTVVKLATADGDYKSALRGLEMLGHHYGALSQRQENHLHLHNADPELLRERTNEELEARLRELRGGQGQASPSPASYADEVDAL